MTGSSSAALRPHRGIALPVLRGAAAGCVILVTGALGLAGFFSDLGPGESRALRFACLTGAYLIGSGLVAVLLPRRWYLAVLTAWGPMLLGGVGVYAKLIHPEVATRPSSMLWLPLLLLGVPLVALAGGFLGRWYARRRRWEA